jgi:hypothetical protein
MIQLIVQVPLWDLQTEKARKIDITITHCCVICAKPIKGDKYKSVQLLTNGNIVSTDEDIEDSQGFFPVGPECSKKLILNFAF